MRGFSVILRHEMFGLFISPSTYVATFYFLTLLGFGFRFFIESFSNTDWILPPLSSLVIGLLFGSPALIPFLTMRSFAEERRLGTLETLMAAPVGNLEIVLGKWMASYIYFIFISLASFSFPLIVVLFFPNEATNLGFDKIELWVGSMAYLFTFGASFCAIGIFSSSITRNQMVAGMLTFTILTLYLSLMTIFFSEVSDTPANSDISQIFWSCLGSVFYGLNKMQNFAVGLLDLQTIFHQLVVVVFFLILASIKLDNITK